ncbi:DUF3459 domain-containing protein [uncultured Spirosoma sp.]|uniref:alpha-amylase family glycosyl hydrolase n=1 Tax=uncultured Spirosoma sp. TaxID=278208 RepID=UPI002586125B|nr:DUF3459 domain-containing protein [uncultured Spirosoma sp.]
MSQSAAQKRLLGVPFSTDKQVITGACPPVAKSLTDSVNHHAPLLPLANDGSGYWQLTTDRVKPGDNYTNNTKRVDPASQLQPQGVYGPSQAFDSTVAYWEDSSWINPPIDEYIIYEIDVHTFTPEGTLKALVDKLDHVKQLGTNAILLRPVTPFASAPDQAPDSNFLFVVQYSYGGPDQLQHLINVCHYEGLAVILDLPYEELDWSTTFPDKERSETAHRQHLVQNALMWFRDFHVDALVLAGIHGLPDTDCLLRAIREQTSALTAQTGRQHYLLTEQDLTLVSRGATASKRREKANTSSASAGQIQPSTALARNDCLCDGTFSTILRDLFEREADSATDNAFTKLLQTYHNTDTTSTSQSDYELLKLRAGAVLVGPCIPTLFMGEERGAFHRFRNATNGDPALADVAPDQIERTAANKPITELPWKTLDESQRQTLYRYYQSITALRRQHPALYHLNPNQLTVTYQPENHTVLLHRWYKTDHVLCLLNFSTDKQTVTLPEFGAPLQKLLDSADPAWDGPGASPESLTDTGHITAQPESIVVYTTRH